MTVKLKYYKFNDPETGKLVKDVGFEYSREVRQYAAKLVNGKEEVIRDNTLIKTTNKVPVGTNLEEISEAEFNILEVNQDNSTNAVIRQKRLIAVPKLVKKLQNKEAAKIAKADKLKNGNNKPDVLAESSTPVTFYTITETLTPKVID